MNYLKNKKRNLIRLTQESILLTSTAIPMLVTTHSAHAMFNTLARKTVTNIGTYPSVKTLVGEFEKFSKNTPNYTLRKTTLGNNPGFNYMNPYQQASGSSSNKKTLTSKLFSKISLTPKSSKSPLYSTQQSLFKTPTSESTSPSPTNPKQALLPLTSVQSTNSKPADEPAPSLPNTSKQALLPPTSVQSTQLKPNTKPAIAPKPILNLASHYQQSISTQSTSSTPQSFTTNLKLSPSNSRRQNLSTTINASGFTYPYSGESSSSNPKTQPIYAKVGAASSSSTSNINSTTSTPPINNSSLAYTYNLKIGENLGSEYEPYKLSPKQEGTLEALIKTSVATIVRNNLPGGLSQNKPITLKFDPEAGKYLNESLTSFIVSSAIHTLNSINNQQQ